MPKEQLFDEEVSDNTFLDIAKKRSDKKEDKPEDKGSQDIDWLEASPEEIEDPKKIQAKEDDEGNKQGRGRKSASEQKGDLRRARDEAVERANKLQEQLDQIKEKGVVDSSYEPVLELIKSEAEGDPETFIASYSERKKKLSELNENLESANKRIRDLDIRSSDEWQKEVVNPLLKAENDIYANIAGSYARKSGENIVIDHKELFDPFISSLVGKDIPENAIELKARIKEFSKKFKDKTGEDLDIAGTTRDITTSLADIRETRDRAVSLQNNWETERAEISSRSKQEALERQKAEKEDFVNTVKQSTSRAYLSFDTKVLNGAISDDDVKNAFLDSYKESVSVIEDPSSAPEWGDMMTKNAKGRMFDNLLAKFQEIHEELEEYKNSEKDGLPGFSRKPVTSKGKDVDWLNDNLG
jgi:hypothetical protein